MKTLWWQTVGTGNCHLVLLHGWGLNAEVWRCVSEELASHFTLHLVDLPGYGRSSGYGAMTLAEMANEVLDAAPQNAIWLGWSLGGLVASQIALTHPERVQALVTVASSPCFSAHDAWPGIKPEVLAGFQQQLSADFQRTVERFLALQTMGTETARQDARTLKQTVLALPMPDVAILMAWCRAKSFLCLMRFGRKVNRWWWRKPPMRRLSLILRRSCLRSLRYVNVWPD